MRPILLPLAFAVCALAQTSPFPASLDSPATLGVPIDNTSSALTSPMQIGDTTAQVANATNIPQWSLVTFGAELTQVCLKSGNTLTFGTPTVCPSIAGRGLSGTTVAVHNTGVIGYLNTNAYYHKAVASAIVATEKKLNAAYTSIADYGAYLDGATDDAFAWAAALAQCATNQACHISIPAFATSHVASTINVNFPGFVRISGGAGSTISCTGIVCVSWSYDQMSDSGMDNLTISDPVGNSSTVGLYLDGGSICCGQTRLYFDNVRLEGNSNLQSGGNFAGLGIGLKMRNTILFRFDNLVEQYFNTGALLNASVNGWFHNSEFNDNGGRAIDNEGGNEISCVQCDIEGNTGVGYYQASGTNAMEYTHFEGNVGGHVEIASGTFHSSYNAYYGNSFTVDAGATNATSMFDLLGVSSLVNNAPGGGYGAGLTIYGDIGLNPTGTGWTQVWQRTGLLQFHATTSYTFVGASGAGYGFDQPVSMPYPILTGSTLPTVTGCGANSIGGTLTKGYFSVTTTGGCNATITLPSNANPLGWFCSGADINSSLPMVMASNPSATSCHIAGTTTNGDRITFFAY